MKRNYNRVYAAVDMDAFLFNVQAMLQKLQPEVKLTLVVKTDGYGHGAVPLALEAEQIERVWGFAVATAEEAFVLRREGIKKPILVLGYTFEEDYEEMVLLNIRPTVFKKETAEAFSKLAVKHQKIVPIHIGVDTGMNRIGFQDNKESLITINEIRRMEGLLMEGVFTHFARADEANKMFARAQLLRFVSFVTKMEKANIKFQYRHCANSACILELPETQIDLVRAGITTYGIYPSDEMDREAFPLKPMMELKSRIVLIKEIHPGDTVSYGGTYQAVENRMVATIPVGYGDGYPRSLSNKGYVLIHGKKAPILGRVCMDQFMVDVTEIPEAKELDEVTLMGRDGEEYLSVDTLAALSGRFPYEFVCDIGKRVPRVYFKEGKPVEVADELMGNYRI